VFDPWLTSLLDCCSRLRGKLGWVEGSYPQMSQRRADQGGRRPSTLLNRYLRTSASSVDQHSSVLCAFAAWRENVPVFRPGSWAAASRPQVRDSKAQDRADIRPHPNPLHDQPSVGARRGDRRGWPNSSQSDSAGMCYDPVSRKFRRRKSGPGNGRAAQPVLSIASATRRFTSGRWARSAATRGWAKSRTRFT
jgi:hypothetical protein